MMIPKIYRHTGMFRAALRIAAVLAFGPAAAAALQGVPDSFAPVARSAKPAVVNISTTRLVRSGGSTGDPAEDFFRQFFGEGLPPRVQRQQSLGSGFLISADGYIVTNAHVVQQADQIQVKLSTREEYAAKLIGVDPKTDVALIKISPAKEIPFARLGNSDSLEVGDWVVAIGNPFGLAETVTVGIVSAKGRVIGAGPYDDFIQTDASINPGNSGGPLLNLQGEVIGINSAIFSRSGGSVGIGFAIPINMAKHIADELRSRGRVVRGFLGVNIQDVTPALAQSFGLDHPTGALVVDVEAKSPAETAGLRRGDIILSVNGTAIEQSHQLPAQIAELEVGSTAEMTVLRDGREQTLSARLAEAPAEGRRSAPAANVTADWGLNLAEANPSLLRRFRLPAGTRGVVVESVNDNSPAAQSDLMPGDVIRQINRQPVSSVRAAQQALATSGRRVLLLIQRGSETGFITLSR